MTFARPAAERGRCIECRHTNHGTMDAEDGFWACPWLGATGPDDPCRIVYADTGLPVFERHDGQNGTWGSAGSAWRAAPAGFQARLVVLAPDA